MYISLGEPSSDTNLNECIKALSFVCSLCCPFASAVYDLQPPISFAERLVVMARPDATSCSSLWYSNKARSRSACQIKWVVSELS